MAEALRAALPYRARVGARKRGALLHPRTHVALHEVTAPLRDEADNVLITRTETRREGSAESEAARGRVRAAPHEP